MQRDDLWQSYPTLYHIAWGGSWPSIKEHGLLSTRALLRSYAKTPEEIEQLTRVRREHWVEIDCQSRQRAVLRDQKPLTDKGLRRALPDSVEPWQWYEVINSMVFFWPTKERLSKMISAATYENVTHDVLVVDTKTLVEIEQDNIRLSPINSGYTLRNPKPRDLDLFKPIMDYPFKERCRTRGIQNAIAEVCVVCHVKRIAEAVRRVESGLAQEVMEAINRA